MQVIKRFVKNHADIVPDFLEENDAPSRFISGLIKGIIEYSEKCIRHKFLPFYFIENMAADCWIQLAIIDYHFDEKVKKNCLDWIVYSFELFEVVSAEEQQFEVAHNFKNLKETLLELIKTNKING